MSGKSQALLFKTFLFLTSFIFKSTYFHHISTLVECIFLQLTSQKVINFFDISYAHLTTLLKACKPLYFSISLGSLYFFIIIFINKNPARYAYVIHIKLILNYNILLKNYKNHFCSLPLQSKKDTAFCHVLAYSWGGQELSLTGLLPYVQLNISYIPFSWA